MQTVPTKNFLRVLLWVIAIIGIWAIPVTVQQANALEIVIWQSKRFQIVGLFALVSIFSLWIVNTSLLDRLAKKIDDIHKSTALGVALVIIGFLLVWVVRLYAFGNILPQTVPIIWVFLLASLLQTYGIKRINPKLSWYAVFICIVLFQGVLYQTYGLFRIVSSDPFSVGYSEAGRFYYASMFFSESIYGIKLPLPFLHPSRYLLLSLPFLIKDPTLASLRFWQSFLWFALTLSASFSLVNRFKLDGWSKAAAIAWIFLYFLQGAVYYHLQVCVFLIFIGISVKNNWRSLFFIILASVWAGISRVNWFPVPAMLAIAIYLLETPLNHKGWKYWITPFVWGIVGVGSALIAQFIYISISGNVDVSAFGSSFTSDLIWSRLLPNETYPVGIFPAIVIVSLPLWIALYQLIKNNIQNLHPLRWLALLAMLLILFAGGLVVSTKIGGGGDLHNMDAYMVLLGLLTMSLWMNQLSAEDARVELSRNEAKPVLGKISWGVVFMAILIPLWFAIPKIGFFHSYDKTIAEQDVQKIQTVVTQTLQTGGRVLFITERQMLTFDIVNELQLIPEYEQTELMEMAMSRNRFYLEQFYSDLSNHRFDLIVAEKQKNNPKKEGSFWEEDYAWVHYVGAPFLCYYEAVDQITSNNIYFFVPRTENLSCSNPFGE